MRRTAARVSGLSVAVPRRVAPVEDARFRRSTGIHERRIALPGTSLASLALPACETLLEALRWERESVGALVVVTQTPDVAQPSMACIFQGALGLSEECAAFDINLGCSGYPYGLVVAGGLLDPSRPRALLVVGDLMGKIRASAGYAPLFGDAVSATALEWSAVDAMTTELRTNGKRWDAITERTLRGVPPIEDGNTHFVLKGEDVYQFTMREVPPAARRVSSFVGVPIEELDAVVFHQANKLINAQLAARLGLRPEQAPSTLEKFGNVNSATIPLTLHRELGVQLAEKPSRLLLCGFGVGLSWGTTYLQTSGVVCPPLVEV